MRTINLIVAVDEEYGFGKDGKIPWHYPEDFKFFKNTTKGHVCIMGRKTFDDLLTYANGKKVLPDRQCIVVTSTPISYEYDNVHIATSINDALDISNNIQGDVFFIGGESIFSSGLQLADCVYMTQIPGTYGCDRHFPYKKLLNNFQLYEKKVGDGGLIFNTYIHNIFGNKNPHN
ncbi:dihydrofolate reductase [Enterobacter hormaechei]|uniref:dihydrofolate reductase n=1 Tax=Gammaproteobacteria TaxID=1236 RepID=UPI001C63E2A8|nr:MULTISPECIES: dihydrofolate reductase [Gammaproteobacteria]MBW7685823.1 dihydrofolate reductase [Enterobacter hormaechei]